MNGTYRAVTAPLVASLPVYLRYTAVSVCALLADITVYFGGVATGLPPALSAMTGYVIGIVLHWTLSSRTVFAPEAALAGTPGRRRQKMLFIVSGVVGLGITVFAVDAAIRFGVGVGGAKAIAALASFQAVWFLRRVVVFTRRA